MIAERTFDPSNGDIVHTVGAEKPHCRVVTRHTGRVLHVAVCFVSVMNFSAGIPGENCTSDDEYYEYKIIFD